MSCIERIGNGIESSIFGVFAKLGSFIGNRPKITIALSILLTIACGAGFTQWTTESRPEKLWVPQDTQAEQETERYQAYFDSNIRFNNLLVQTTTNGGNVLTKDVLLQAMELHTVMQTKNSTVTLENDNNDVEETVTNTLLTLCAKGGFGCTSSSTVAADVRGPICDCFLTGILGAWNFDLSILEEDEDVVTTLNNQLPQDQLVALLGNPTIEDDKVIAAQAFSLTFFLEGRLEIINNAESDPLNDAWEEQVFLATAEEGNNNDNDGNYPLLSVNYIAARSFNDEFGSAITGDLALVNISYMVVFLFLGATLGSTIRCGKNRDSRWTMSLAALVTVGLSVGAGFGISSLAGLFFGPVHSLLPFILIGIGVDDAFVIVNAFNRERTTGRQTETNDTIAQRAARSLGRAGASITVTSTTDLVAFAISSTSALPALASFCAYAAICIFFLWFFASTFFTGCLVLDERRQRDERYECLCCFPRPKKVEAAGGAEEEEQQQNDDNDDDDQDIGYQEGLLSRYFRNYHAPLILSSCGKVVVLLVFAALLALGIYGAINLPVEDTQRAFIPSDSYVTEWLSTFDNYFTSSGGIELAIVFENNNDNDDNNNNTLTSTSTSIYEARQALVTLDKRLTGQSTASPWIAEPVPTATYQNVMVGYQNNLEELNVELGEDGWPTSAEDFSTSLAYFVYGTEVGRAYVNDVKFSNFNNNETGTGETMKLEAIQIKSEYVALTKVGRGDKIIDDADRQIDAMDDTRSMVESWTDLGELSRFVYSEKFIAIEGFKVIQKELFFNVGLALGAVAILVLVTVASPVTALLITLAVAMCLMEILGFMYVLGIAIDSVSVINLVLAVGLSVDYSAHIGHCFMTKVGSGEERATEALADIGAAVLSGATSTFLAVVVLLFSSSYVFSVLSKQFALTVGLGVLHGLVLLPVLLSLCGPKPFASANANANSNSNYSQQQEQKEEPTKHEENANSSSSGSGNAEQPLVEEDDEAVVLERYFEGESDSSFSC